MQHGDRATQSTDNFVTLAEKPENPVGAAMLQTAPATQSVSGVTAETATVSMESTPQLSSRSRLQLRIGSLSQRLREQRREAAAVVVLVVIAMVWSDTDSSETGPASNSSDPLDSYEAVLSDFKPVGDVKAMPESADPFESSFKNSFDGGLYFPPSEESAPSASLSANDPSSDSGSSMPAPAARYPDTSPAFNASATHSSVDDSSDQQQRRRVKFAGRIQPAN